MPLSGGFNLEDNDDEFVDMDATGDTSFDVASFDQELSGNAPSTEQEQPIPAPAQQQSKPQPKQRKKRTPKPKQQSIPKPEVNKFAVGTYLTLKDGTEVQISGEAKFDNNYEATYPVRYPDNIMSGNSYEIRENDIIDAKISNKYSNRSNQQSTPEPTLSLSSGSGAGSPPQKPPAPPSSPDPPDDPNDPSKYPKLGPSLPTSSSNKEEESDRKRSLSELKQKLREIIQDEKEAFRKDIREERNRVNRSVQELNNEAILRRSDISRASSEAKAGVYSLSAAAGLPGYISASIVDALFMRPAVQEDLAAEKAYQQDLKRYKNFEEDQRNRQKDRFQEFLKSAKGLKPTPEDVEFFKETGEIPQGLQTSFDQWQEENPDTSPGIPPVQKPTPPVSKSANILATVSKAAPIVAAVVEGLQFVNNVIKDGQVKTRDQIDSLMSKQGIQGMASSYAGYLDATNPLGLNPVQTAFSESVKTFDKAVTTFESFAKKDMGFSPETLMVDVNASIMKLNQSMEIASRTDSQKASLLAVTEELQIIWNEFRTEFFITFAPAMMVILRSILDAAKGLLIVVRTIHTAVLKIIEAVSFIVGWIPQFALLGMALKRWLGSQNKVEMPQNIHRMLEEFHDPQNQPVKPFKPGNFK